MTNCHVTVVAQLVLQTSFGGHLGLFQIQIKFFNVILYIYIYFILLLGNGASLYPFITRSPHTSI
jgi:hypothetical protein